MPPSRRTARLLPHRPQPTRARISPEIRLAKAAEVSFIADLWAAFQREHNSRYVRVVRGTRLNIALMTEHFAKLQAVDQLWVIAKEEAVVGFAAVSPNLPKLDLFYASATLTDLYVRPAWRGQGLGRQLLDGVVAAVAARGLHALTLSVMAGNPALAMYAKAGFQPFSQTLVMPLEPGWVQTGSEYPVS